MPMTKEQKLIYAFITVIITVPCFVFYCSSYEVGGFSVDVIKSSCIFIPIEFVLAYLCEIFIGSPLSLKIALKTISKPENKNLSMETVIICSTVLIMCPLMSFLATILYDGIIAVGMNGASFTNFFINFIPFWLQKVVLNFPFALISQLFFIQPLVRFIFGKLFAKEKTNTPNKNEFEVVVDAK